MNLTTEKKPIEKFTKEKKLKKVIGSTNINKFVETSNRYFSETIRFFEDRPITNEFDSLIINNSEDNKNNSSFLKKSKLIRNVILSLNLEKKRISNFPEKILIDFKILTTLDLSMNKFGKIPDEIFSMSSLKTLKINFNMIKTIDENLFETINLEYFSISHNLIEYVPSNINKWKNSLAYLDVSNNQIHDLGDEINEVSVLFFKFLIYF